MSYAESTRTPRTLTDAEQARLLKVTGEHARGFRDHVLLSFALGTALREAELLALNVGDVFGAEGKARRRVQLRVFKRSNDDESMQEVVLPDPLRAKLEKLWRWKKQRGESLEPDAPLFVSRRGLRLSSRQLRSLFHIWQERAGFERVLSFHSTTSASWAAARALSAQHSSRKRQSDALQSSELVEKRRQSRCGGSKGSSLTSPVAVCRAQTTSARSISASPGSSSSSSVPWASS
jgi:site-specific recombinase XerC